MRFAASGEELQVRGSHRPRQPHGPAATNGERNEPSGKRPGIRFALALATAAGFLIGAGSPAFVTSDPNGGWASGGYYVHNNLWNRAQYDPCTSTLTAWSHDQWQVVTRMNNRTGDGAVKTYPNVHRNYNHVPIAAFESLTSRFAATAPGVGIYNVAYDLWINGIATPGCTEIMIWTENRNQVPGGRYAREATFGDHRFKVYRRPAGNYLAFVATTNFNAGTVDLLAMLKWTISQGWLPATSTVSQVCFGIEMVSTDDTDATFRVSAFSIDGRLGTDATRADSAAPAVETALTPETLR